MDEAMTSEHVYWIGGGSGAGKSTIARRLADRHGLRLYSTDDVMADHGRRINPSDAPLLRAFAAMDMDERWLNRSPQVMLETFHWFRGEGFGLIAEDLRELSRESSVIAEGFRLLPDLVAPHLTGPVSPEHIEQARRNVPDGEFICSDALTATFPAGHFDAVISLYTFDHIPRDEYRGMLDSIHRWLRPDGMLLLSVEDIDEPGTVAQWLGVDMYFSMFGADAMRQLVRDAGFDITKTALGTQTEGGTDISYTWILARKV
jgi:SAM-dependent methyltransferase